MKNIVYAILCALSFSAFIYVEHFDIHQRIIPSICAFVALFLYLNLTKKSAFICGALVGILWFYWISLSFRYYDATYLIPFVILFVAFVYGILFVALCFFDSHIYRISTLLLTSFIHPFSFNWFIPEAMLINSYFPPTKLTLFLILTLSSFCIYALRQKYYKSMAIVCFVALLSISLTTQQKQTNTNDTLKIKTIQTNIDQDLRWDKNELEQIVISNMNEISQAINEKYNIVILPETAFPLPLNRYENLIETLKEKSKQITIISGGINQEDNNFYNSAYIFENGDVKIFNKIILVPFGEQIPLPKILVDLINKYFFNSAVDFASNNTNTINTATINNTDFNIAICYEATRDEFYKNDPKLLIAISNNAWFYPSIQPTLQKLLMQYFSKNYNTTIYHSSNKSPSFTIYP